MERDDTPGLPRRQRERRAFIEHRVFWTGRIGLRDLSNVMQLSRAQASLDLNGYIDDHPGNLVYDKSAKTYLPGPEFTPVYADLDPGAHLAELLAISSGSTTPRADWIASMPTIEATAVPGRGLDRDVVRALLQAIDENRDLEITYQSMSSLEPTRRTIAPHALAHDGFRWHARAFCYRDERHKDFVLARMSECQIGDAARVGSGEDEDWNEIDTLVIRPHPKLSESQRIAVERDYGMTNGVAQITTRRAMRFYTIKRLGLDVGSRDRALADQHIVLVGPVQPYTEEDYYPVDSWGNREP